MLPKMIEYKVIEFKVIIESESAKDNGKFRILAIGNVWNAQFHFPFHRPKFPFLKRLSYRLYNRNKILKTNYILLLFCARVIIMKSLVTFMAKNVLVWEKQGFNQQNFFLFALKDIYLICVHLDNSKPYMAIEQPFDLDRFISGKNKISTYC